jgi:hypothetical protein
MRYLFVCLVTALLLPAAVAQDRSSEHARKTLEIYRTIIEIDTSKHTGNTPKVAKYLADELIAAGFAPEDVEVVSRRLRPWWHGIGATSVPARNLSFFSGTWTL